MQQSIVHLIFKIAKRQYDILTLFYRGSSGVMADLVCRVKRVSMASSRKEMVSLALGPGPFF